MLAKTIKQSVYEETASFPAKITYSKRIRAIASQLECKCKQCNTVHGDPDREYCSNECYQNWKRDHAPTKEQAAVENAITKGERKFAGKTEGIDYLVCAICGAKSGDLGAHVGMHGITPAEYKVQYDISVLKPMSYRDARRGELNPGYGHGGKFSAWSKNFIHGYDQQRHAAKNQEFKDLREKSPEKFKSTIEYWLVKCDGNLEAAQNAYKKWQTRDLDFFITKYGPEDGVARHTAKTEKWIKSYRKQNFSKISQMLFNEIIGELPVELKVGVYFATHARDDMASYVNKEYILKVEHTYVRPDFVCTTNNRIIEFDGDYWHSPAMANPAREALRDSRIIAAGYAIHHVKEHEYKKDKNKVIQECLNFLKQ